MQFLKKIQENWKILTGVGAILISVVGGFHTLANQYEEIIDTMHTTQQMALKSVIWNDEIPYIERASACDKYLNEGYNSATKKLCENIVENNVREG